MDIILNRPDRGKLLDLNLYEIRHDPVDDNLEIDHSAADERPPKTKVYLVKADESPLWTNVEDLGRLTASRNSDIAQWTVESPSSAKENQKNLIRLRSKVDRHGDPSGSG